MNFPPEILKSVAVYHLPTASGVQSYPSTADATIDGAFLPLDRYQHALEGGDLVAPFELYVGGTDDVRVSDKLVIESITYYVKKIFPANFGGLAHQRCSISTQP